MMWLSELRRRMAEAGVDGVLICDEVSASYLSGFDFSDGYLAVLGDKAFLVTDFRYTEAACAGVRDGFEVVEAHGGTLHEAIDRLIAGKTTLMIAHRLSTLRRANRILVVDGGRIVENGTPEELMALQGKYYKLIQIQTMSDQIRKTKEEERFE